MSAKILLVIATAIGCISASSLTVKNPTVSIEASSLKHDGNVFALAGAANCGNGHILDVRMTGCTTAPCEFRRGQTYNLQVDFINTGSRDFGTVYFKSIALKDNVIETVTSDVHLPGVNLQPNAQYIFNYDLTVPSSGFIGNDSELRLKVYQNLWKPLCVVIPATFVN